MWERGEQLGQTNTEGNKLYGKKYWKRFIKTHDYYFVEFNSKIKRNMIPMGYFDCPDIQKYENYKKFRNYAGDFNDFKVSSLLINSYIKKFNYEFFKIRHDPLFKIKEFGQFAILIREIYQYGSYNYPSWKINETFTINSHPGQHLNFAKMYLNHPIIGFVSFPKTNNRYKKFVNRNSKIIKKIQSDTDIIDILKTDVISASIQQYDGQLVPSFYPSIPRPVWSGYDANGNTDWPWDQAANFYDYLEQSSYIHIIDEIIFSKTPIDIINNYAIIHNNFDSEEQLINNFISFLLTETNQDTNFEMKKIQ